MTDDPQEVDQGETTARAAPDDEQKSYETILDQQVETALHELERPTRGLFMSGVSAGLDVGFSAFAVATVATLIGDQLSEPIAALLKANAYAVGFIFVIFGRSELFTEHTTLAVLPVLDARATLRQLTRLWGLVFAGNILGTSVFGVILATVGPSLKIVDPSALAEIAHQLNWHAPLVIVGSAMLAGWMMGLLCWLVTAGRETTSEIFFVWLVTSLIGLGHLHHCIVGNAELVAAWVASPDVPLWACVRTLVLATVGNIGGGVLFVALVK